jgi:hypothetical protein
MRFVGLALCLVLGTVGCRADAQRCEKAARNFATLTYWKKTDAEIAAAPAAKRAELRKQKLAEFTAELEHNIQFWVGQCQSANNDDQIDCMIGAKTAEEALDCADVADNKAD